MFSRNPVRRLLQAGPILAMAVSGAASADDVPLHQQILDHLKTDADVVLPWMPEAQDVATMHNRETPIPPQCYTDSHSQHNPCYVCHQNEIPGRENTKNDRDLQEAYSFSDEGLTNHWYNLFEDRSARVASISDAEILAYINQDNYSELPQRLRDAGFSGWIPDLANLQEGAAAFDAEGFALDNSWWVAFSYKPLPSTFWPTQGSTDDVMIRLPPEFYKTGAGVVSRDIYKTNLALLEANIKGFDSIDTWPIDENSVGLDLNGDSQLSVVSRINRRTHYVGAASQFDLIPHVYPQGTEFLHTVRYVGVAPDGSIHNPRRMKEVRYMKRRLQSRHFQLQHYYEEENLEKVQGSLPTYQNFGHDGLSSNFGWNITGFIENREGRLRWNTFEENVFCMGCHTSIGSTIDKTFSFARKVDGVAGWGYINLHGMRDAANAGETLNEVATYLNRVGGGTEFRSNPELEARFYHADGSVNTVALASARDMYELTTPTPARALQLNKAYKAIVEEQDFIYGRDATVTPPQRVLENVDNETSPTLPPERQYDWNILLDWSSAASASCNYQGDVDFSPLASAHVVTLSGRGSENVNRVCAAGSVVLAGALQVRLDEGVQPQIGDRFEIVRGGNISGNFTSVVLPPLQGAVFLLQRTATSVALVVAADSDSDGIADRDDNCVEVANSTTHPDAGGHSQRDSDDDGFGNLCDADLDNSGFVNAADLARMKNAFGSQGADADLDGNGVVNSADLARLKSLFGKAPGPSRISE